jgi:hypothetical protein
MVVREESVEGERIAGEASAPPPRDVVKRRAVGE